MPRLQSRDTDGLFFDAGADLPERDGAFVALPLVQVGPVYGDLPELAALDANAGAASRDGVPPGAQANPAREALYEEMQPLVRRLLRQYASTPELREDLSGELYVRFCAFHAAFDAGRGIPVHPYMVRMLSHAAYNYMRTYWKQQEREASLVISRGDTRDATIEPAADPTSEWEHALWLEQAIDQLPQAIRRLPKRQQRVVISRYFDGRSFEEIAVDMGVQPATVRSLLRHAINKLRDLMGTGE